MIRPDESIDDLMYRALYRSAILVVWELKSPPGRFDPPHAREDRMPAVWILELDEHDQAADRPDIDQSGAKLDFLIPRARTDSDSDRTWAISPIRINLTSARVRM